MQLAFTTACSPSSVVSVSVFDDVSLDLVTVTPARGFELQLLVQGAVCVKTNWVRATTG